MATVTPSKTADRDTPATRTPFLGRAVIWIGLALGTAATVLAVMRGIRIPRLEVVLSVSLMWVLLIIVAVTVAELLRRHHRTAARHAWRHGKRARCSRAGTPTEVAGRTRVAEVNARLATGVEHLIARITTTDRDELQPPPRGDDSATGHHPTRNAADAG
ncbi:MAG: hypothetical protein ABSF03_10390 [Streptosporangiaceae bacterium]|jgi:hypothetical protein